MDPLRIAAVSYLNTYPFVFGITQSGLLPDYNLELMVPSLCAGKLKSGETDIALVPAGALPEIGDYHILSDYCIGAVREVRTVLLLSQVPLEDISVIHLDYDSRTSVQLVRVLAKEFWRINPSWKPLLPGEAGKADRYESLVAIGDKTFDLRSKYRYVYDLAEAWILHTGLPFVFAAWISRKRLPDSLPDHFNQALAFGVSRKAECLDFYREKLPAGVDCLGYLENNISFGFDEQKKEGLKRFLSSL